MKDYLLENLSPRQIKEISEDIKKGIADPLDAKRLMIMFCEYVNNKKEPPKELMIHFKDVFNSILLSSKTVQASLGLARKKSRPKAETENRVDMAYMVLLSRLDGESHQNALSAAAVKFGYTETIIGKAWKEYKQVALDTFRVQRYLESKKITQKEEIKIAKILKL